MLLEETWRGLGLQSSSTNTTNLNHCRDVSLDVCKFDLIKFIKADELEEMGFRECARNETLVHTFDVLARGKIDLKGLDLPRAAPIIPNDRTANHSRQFNTSFGSSPRLSLKIF